MVNENWKKSLPISGIQEIKPVTGGDVNKAYQVLTAQDTYFLLVQPDHDKEFYAGEIAGLKMFQQADILSPEVLDSGEIDGDAYLLWEFIDQGVGSQADLGRLVAKLHHYHNPNGQFGFSESSSATLRYDNSWTSSWSELFVQRRLDRIAKAIMANNLWNQREQEQYNKVRQKILLVLSQHDSKPSLVHGDLWGGNHLFTKSGQPVLIDPDAFFGDREFDLGVSLVFNAFDNDFYQAYQKEYPLEDGYELRLNFYKLYLLMVHLYKFGGIYAHGVNQTMRTILEN